MTIYSAYSGAASALTLLAGRNAIQPRLFLLQPTVVFAARVNLVDPADYPISFVAYDTVTTGAYTDIKPGMTILLGSVAGGDQYGRQRVRGPVTPATAISIYVGRSSRGIADGELTLVDNAYITVWDDRRVWAKIPYIDSSGGIFKDSDLAVGTYTTTPPPVANMGEGDARTIDPDTNVITLLFNGQPSYATAAGATITTYLWDIADGTLVSGTLADDNITATWPAGFRYVKLTVTDSNGKTAFTERPVFADALDHSLSFDGFAIESHRITDAGQTMTIRALEDMPRATYPDGTLAMIWDSEPTAAANRDHMLIIGWLDSEDASHNASRTGLLRDTTLTIQDVAARLDTLPGFPQSLADDSTRDTAKIPAITWNYMIAPTMDLYMHYLLAWHSTALEVTDFYWSNTGTSYRIAIKNSDGESLWQQVARTAQAMIPGYCLTCQQAGRIRVKPDPMLLDSADRTSTVEVPIREDNYSDLHFTYQRAPRTHWLRTGALVAQASITFNTDGTVYLPTVFSRAPGATPGQGLGEVDNNEGLVSSQTVLNSATGHKYARMNAPVGMATLTLIQDDQAALTAAPWREIEPALKEWVTIRLGADYAAQRGLTFDTLRALPKEINIRYNMSKAGLTRTVELTAEIETSGQPAETETKPTVPAVGAQPVSGDIPTDFPSFGLITSQDLVAGIDSNSGSPGFLYRTFNFTNATPTWERLLSLPDGTTGVFSFVVDPFSPGYINRDGTGLVNGWVATASKIYRVTDIFGTPACTLQYTFATTISSAGVSSTRRQKHRTIQASFGQFLPDVADNPWLMCVSHYHNAASHTGTWAVYSQDGGTTWSSEIQISAHYDSSSSTGRPWMTPGVYLSPKTPGLAYTVAFTNTASPATADGFVSSDWGATWTAITNPDIQPNNGLAGGMHVPWHGNDDETLVYHGHITRGATLGYRLKRVELNGTTITDISPSNAGRTYGPHKENFGIRAYDPDNSYMVMGAFGNDTTANNSGDNECIFVSSNGGDTWTKVYGPLTWDQAFDGLAAAFAADDSDVLYGWGAAFGQTATMLYSDDFGATWHDKSGNIHADWGIGGDPSGFVGICGGPIP